MTCQLLPSHSAYNLYLLPLPPIFFPLKGGDFLIAHFFSSCLVCSPLLLFFFLTPMGQLLRK